MRVFFLPKYPNSPNFRHSSESTDFPGLRNFPLFGHFTPNFCILILQFLSLHRPLIHPHIQRAFGLGAQKITVKTVSKINLSFRFGNNLFLFPDAKGEIGMSYLFPRSQTSR